MKSKERAVSPDSRVEYRWAADREAGFEQSTFIYDEEGRLIAIDYGTRGMPPDRDRTGTGNAARGS